ncbi:MAG TPA: MOSC N-terminal beta barrel domain-containing protein [Steroidobacteraceae bacterium]
MTTLAGLYVYPVKSCRGIAVASALLTNAGLQHDREWMVVSPDGRFLTQRDTPRLALVVPTIEREALTLDAPGMVPLTVPLDADGERRVVTVWREQCRAIDAGASAATWFSDFLGRPSRLVRFDPAARRPTDAAWSQGLDAESRFADAFPLLVLSRASLDDLNARLPTPLPLDRFRPNLLLDVDEPYVEDRLGSLSHGRVQLRLVKPCTRCVITTTDQASATVGGDEPLRTLRTYRWDAALRGVTFGQNAIIASGAGERLMLGLSFE